MGQKLLNLSVLAKNFAISELSWHIEYDFLKEDQKNNFHSKNQEDSQRRLEVIDQKLSNLSTWDKNGQILALLNAHNFAISEFSWYIQYDFLKKTRRTTSKPKDRRIHRGVWKLQAKTLKTLNFGQKWPNFGLKCPKFHHIRTFLAYRV